LTEGPSNITNVGVSVDSMAEGINIGSSSSVLYVGFEVGETALRD
jgi:hypothetical protein